jgi:hypothetical protein
MTITNARVFEDAFNLFCGDLLGSGIHRKVFECKLRDDLVVKVEDNEVQHAWRAFANVHEMRFWEDHQHYKPIADWLAPCEWMSPDGLVLLQKRVSPLPLDYQLPEQMPSFLTDFKRANFGLYEGRLVCVDYSTTIPNPSRKPKKAHW